MIDSHKAHQYCFAARGDKGKFPAPRTSWRWSSRVPGSRVGLEEGHKERRGWGLEGRWSEGEGEGEMGNGKRERREGEGKGGELWCAGMAASATKK